MNDNISGWNDWSSAFADWTDISISELHGLMTGIMTVCHAPDMAGWQALFSELSLSEPDESALTLLTEEAEDTSFQLKDKDDAYAYTPLVPDDEHDLYERVLALKNWSSGFMTGFGMTSSTLSSEENEMLADLSKIASIRINPDDEFDGGEEAYLHLYEFARMIPVSLATRQRKHVKELPLIAGLPLDAKTATEVAQEREQMREQERVNKPIPPVVDAMNSHRPS
ncbi:UPF0149 family protein [Psychrobacter sp. I-STPA6b]|uniref:UPF0149 family protein n=1 Tax=Psychrobacter sp. I-STPA6b TaxID=2585718 RepID=UPI001D0CCEEA|nr:UPF0149 family protein [Psychrobacter sp. I-STPA6b]